MKQYRVPDEIRKLKVNQMDLSIEIISYLQTHGCETIEDVIRKQNELPKEIITPIKAKLIFGIDL